MLALCLERLKPGVQTLSKDLYEIIVTDDGSDDEAKPFIDDNYPWVKWVSGPKRGPAANRNNGAKIASGEWLVFTDDDCLPDSGWLQSYQLAIQENPHCMAFEGAILPDDAKLLDRDMAECPVNEKGGCFWSANVMIQKDIFQAINGFDERFEMAAQEDQDIYERLQPVTLVPFIAASVVIHPVRVILLSKKLRKIFPEIENWYKFMKNRNKLGKILYVGVRFHLISLIARLKASKFKSATVSLVSLIVFIPALIRSRLRYGI